MSILVVMGNYRVRDDEPPRILMEATLTVGTRFQLPIREFESVQGALEALRPLRYSDQRTEELRQGLELGLGATLELDPEDASLIGMFIEAEG